MVVYSDHLTLRYIRNIRMGYIPYVRMSTRPSASKLSSAQVLTAVMFDVARVLCSPA
jgi:hypothetical protein